MLRYSRSKSQWTTDDPILTIGRWFTNCFLNPLGCKHTQKGKPLKDGTTAWVCADRVKFKCPGRIRLNPDKTIHSIVTDHRNHGSDERTLVVQEVCRFSRLITIKVARIQLWTLNSMKFGVYQKVAQYITSLKLRLKSRPRVRTAIAAIQFQYL